MTDPWAAMDDDPWVKAVSRFEPRAREVLGLGPDGRPTDFVEALERQNARMAEAQARLAAEQFTVTSGDGLLAVTMTGRGALLGLHVDDDAYAQYQPRDLAAAILETIWAAQARCGEVLREVLGDALTDTTAVDAVVAGMPGRPAGEAPVQHADWA